MTVIALLLIVGTNILVGAIQLVIFVKNAREVDKLLNMASEQLIKITEIAMENLSKAGVKIGKLLDVLDTLKK